MTEVRLRPLAETDLVERTRYYRSEGGDELGSRFFEASIQALGLVERLPGAGSLRGGEIGDVPGLRHHPVAGFPCGWFYFEREGHVDVVRLLAFAQDLAAILGDIVERFQQLPELDPRHPDDIIGYDEHGLPG